MYKRPTNPPLQHLTPFHLFLCPSLSPSSVFLRILSCFKGFRDLFCCVNKLSTFRQTILSLSESLSFGPRTAKHNGGLFKKLVSRWQSLLCLQLRREETWAKAWSPWWWWRWFNDYKTHQERTKRQIYPLSRWQPLLFSFFHHQQNHISEKVLNPFFFYLTIHLLLPFIHLFVFQIICSICSVSPF